MYSKWKTLKLIRLTTLKVNKVKGKNIITFDKPNSMKTKTYPTKDI